MVNFLILGRSGYVPLALAKVLQGLGHSPFFLSRFAAHGSGDYVFVIPENSPFPSSRLRQYILDNQIDAVINTSNRFSRTLGIDDLESAMTANFLHPARVLAIAADAGLKKFMNLASAWQLDEIKRSQHPIYTGTKNALLEFEKSYESKIEIWDVFVAEIFGLADTRPKLLNLIREAAKSGENLELHSLRTNLHLTSIDRLAEHIESLLLGHLNAPKSHLFVNYPSVPVLEILEIANAAIASDLKILDRGLEPEVLSLDAPLVGEADASELRSDLGKFFQFETL
jgi:hypothetical protein